MNINLHNKFEINIKDKTYCFFNKMTDNVASVFLREKDFASYIGVYAPKTSSDDSNSELGTLLIKKSAIIVDSNFNKKNGIFFVKRKIVLKKNELVGSTIGGTSLLCDNQEYTKVNECKFKDFSGKEMSIKKGEEEITIFSTCYLSIEGDNIELYEGENPLVKMLLCGGKISECDLKIVTMWRLSYNKNINVSDIRKTYNASASFFNNVLSIDANIPFTNERSVSLIIDGVRSVFFGVEYFLEHKTMTANYDSSSLTALPSGAFALTNVTDSANNKQEVYYEKFAKDSLYRDELDFIWREQTKVYSSTNGRFVAFITDNELEIYEMTEKKIGSIYKNSGILIGVEINQIFVTCDGNVYIQPKNSYKIISIKKESLGYVHQISTANVAVLEKMFVIERANKMYGVTKMINGKYRLICYDLSNNFSASIVTTTDNMPLMCVNDAKRTFFWMNNDNIESYGLLQHFDTLVSKTLTEDTRVNIKNAKEIYLNYAGFFIKSQNNEIKKIGFDLNHVILGITDENAVVSSCEFVALSIEESGKYLAKQYDPFNYKTYTLSYGGLTFEKVVAVCLLSGGFLVAFNDGKVQLIRNKTEKVYATLNSASYSGALNYNYDALKTNYNSKVTFLLKANFD